MSIFSEAAKKIFDATNILVARGFQVRKPNGAVGWGVNGQGYMAIGRQTASYPAHIVTPAGSSLGVVVTDNSKFSISIGWHNSVGVVMVQASGVVLALGVNGQRILNVSNSFGVSIGLNDNGPLTSPAILYVNEGARAGGKAVRIVGLDNETEATAIEVIDENANNYFYIKSVAGSNAGRGYFLGNVGFGTETPTGPVDIATGRIRQRTAVTPASATAAANQGEILWNNSGLYVAIGTNSLKRIPFSNSW